MSGFRQFAAQKLGPLNPLPSHLPEIAMAKPKNIEPKVPGVIEPEAAAPVPEAEAPAVEETDLPASDTDAPVDDAEPAADDDAAADDLDEETVEEEVEAAPVRKELPDQSEVDAKAITKPVLTRQGWVVPA